MAREQALTGGKRVLVTGATGFVGRVLVPALRAAGHDVVAPGRDDGVDLLAAESYRPFLEGADAVVHLAAFNPPRLSRAARDRVTLSRINVEAARSLARLARSAGVSRFIQLSSARVYGLADDAAPLPETAPLWADDPYGCSKIAAEAALADVFAEAPGTLLVLRAPVIYGPGRGGVFALVARFAQNGWPMPAGMFDQPKSVLHVETLADCIGRFIGRGGPSGIFNIADRETVTLAGFARRIAGAAGRGDPLFLRFPASVLYRLPTVGPAARHLARPLVLDVSALETTGQQIPARSTYEELCRSFAMTADLGRSNRP